MVPLRSLCDIVHTNIRHKTVANSTGSGWAAGCGVRRSPTPRSPRPAGKPGVRAYDILADFAHLLTAGVDSIAKFIRSQMTYSVVYTDCSRKRQAENIYAAIAAVEKRHWDPRAEQLL